ncbi:unnamed protein product [Prorocentrum cordatum]|uniref:Uncharacterized protein n=1 Tax=Prorocentrum cordatum TaxID=2364126 RepID=A0ABN9TSY9_9DINO|nr:unnamed protein product [Polarella glacialis]
MGLRAPPSGQGAVHCHGPYGNTRCEALLAKAQTSTRRGEPEHCTSGRAEFQASCATEALRRPCEEEDEGGGTEGREGRREGREEAVGRTWPRRVICTPGERLAPSSVASELARRQNSDLGVPGADGPTIAAQG